jgi:hypothetical protein
MEVNPLMNNLLEVGPPLRVGKAHRATKSDRADYFAHP